MRAWQMEKPLPCSFGSPQDFSPGSHLGAKFFQLDPKSLKDCFGVGFCCKDGSSPRTCCLCIEMMLGSFPPKKIVASVEPVAGLESSFAQPGVRNIEKMHQAKDKKIFEN